MDLQKDIYIFTDGSCVKKNNCTKASYGYYMLMGNDIYEEYKILEGEKTNNKAEINGIILAFEKIKEIKPENKKIYIYSDSEYTIKSLTIWINAWKKNGWKTVNKKPVKNIELIKLMDSLYIELKQTYDIEINHIFSHQKEPKKDTKEWLLWYGNNRVDTKLKELTIL
jgi:ribonuclease HI